LDFPVLTNPDSLPWRLRAGQRLQMVEGEDESVIYNDCSGETHLLSAIAVDLLRKLAQGTADFRSISTSIAQAWEFESEEERQETVQNLLAELDALWLIEACRP
jgi:PqqD family protein of HPr-rel-A system